MAKKKLVKYQLIEIVDGEENVLRHKESKAGLRRWLDDNVYDLSVDEQRKVLTAFYDPKINEREWDEPVIEFLMKAAIEDKFKQVVGNEIHMGNKIYMIKEEE